MGGSFKGSYMIVTFHIITTFGQVIFLKIPIVMCEVLIQRDKED